MIASMVKAQLRLSNVASPGGGMDVGSVGDQETAYGIADGSGVVGGSAGAAWMAWTAITRFWTCSINKLNRFEPTTIA